MGYGGDYDEIWVSYGLTGRNVVIKALEILNVNLA